MTTNTKTPRSCYEDILPDRNGGYEFAFFRGMERDGLHAAVRDGFDAFAALWFDSVDEHIDLPVELIRLIELAEKYFMGEVVSDRMQEALDTDA